MSWSLPPFGSAGSCGSKNGDRFIPSRAGANWNLKFQGVEEAEKSLRQKRKSRGNSKGLLTYSALLKNELLGAGMERVQDLKRRGRRLLQPFTPEKKNLFAYSPSPNGGEASPYSLSFISSQSQTLLMSQWKPSRKIYPSPFKILEAPKLQNIFGMNVLDWSSLNVISVGLGTCVFLWNAETCQVTRLCDLAVERDFVTSVSWSREGNLLAFGTQRGLVKIWDIVAQKQLSVLEGHRSRVGVLAWNAEQISSGSHDTLILQRDTRTPPTQADRLLQGHSREVCGLKWSTNHHLLASSGSDGKILLWDRARLKPVLQYTNHQAAVKAIAWSPYQHGLLASGGTTDKGSILFWNTLTEHTLHSIDTGSGVYSLAWSKHGNELVSTHGEPGNEIVIWKYPSLTQVTKLRGHSYRVLYLALSPDGHVIATGSADETLRFWNVFAKTCPSYPSKTVLDLFSQIR